MQNSSEKQQYATVFWTPEDIIEEAEHKNIPMTREQAIEILEKYESLISDAMIDSAWNVIDDILNNNL